jgi:hypothetical protein
MATVTKERVAEYMEQGRWADAIYALLTRVNQLEDALDETNRKIEQNRPDPFGYRIGSRDRY